MHKNFRRTIKQDHGSHRNRDYGRRRRSWSYEKRAVWSRLRAQAAELLHHGKFDALPRCYKKSIAWDYF